MKKLIQANDNAQVNGVTAGEVALCKTLNENAQELGTLGEVENGVQAGKTSLQRVYDTIEDNGNVYTNVKVEGVTPNRMKNLINTQIKKVIPDSDGVTFQTPGEPIVVNNGIDGTEDRKGVVQIYNNAIIDSSVTGISLDVTSDLREGEANVEANATIGTVTVQGTSDEVVVSLDEVGDYSSFVLDDKTLKVGDSPLTAKEYKITLSAVASDVEDVITKEFTISVAEAYPNITSLSVEPVDSLTAPLTVDTVVANLSTEGGTAPYTYTLKGGEGDNAEFKIDGTTVKVGTQIDAGGNKNITVVVTDKNNKTKEQTAEIVIGSQA